MSDITERIKIIPYTEVDGVRNFTDSYIKLVYKKAVEEGTAQFVFIDGTINNEDDFLYQMKSDKNILYLIYEKFDLVAICWLNTFIQRLCYFHFICFKSIWGRAEEFGKYTLKTLINIKDANGEYIFDMFLGITPSKNVHATKYVRDCGGKLIGVLPKGCWNAKKNKSESATLVYYMREENENESIQ